MAATDLTRNDLDRQAGVLYGLDPGAGARCTPGARMPGRTTYLYAWNREASRGVLQPVACP